MVVKLNERMKTCFDNYWALQKLEFFSIAKFYIIFIYLLLFNRKRVTITKDIMRYVAMVWNGDENIIYNLSSLKNEREGEKRSINYCRIFLN